MKPTVMLIGLGGLGSVILELLAREESVGRIIATGRHVGRGQARCNLARLGAMAQGYQPEIQFRTLDVLDTAAVAETLQRESPDLVLCTVTMQTWWLPDLLPVPQSAALKQAGFGMWLPVHLTLTQKFMEAVHLARYAGITLTAPFPDAVNCVLGRLNLAPTCGIGNLDEIVPKIHLLAAGRLHTSLEAVKVWLVAHHALGEYVFGEQDQQPGAMPPYFLRIEHQGQDVTRAIQADELLLSAYPITPGPATHFLTAGSALRLVRALLAEDETLLHVPAPNGLPGGYPVLASRKGVRPVLLPGLSLEQAIALNEQAQRFDGIERIEADGTVVFVSEMVEACDNLLGYRCERLHPGEAEARASELIERFRIYAKNCGVTLPAERYI